MVGNNVRPHDFQDKVGIRYLSSLEFFDSEAEQFAKICWKKKEFDRERRWLGQFHGPDLEKGKIAPLLVRWIDKCLGYGVFADKVFARGDYIGFYAGRLIRRDLLRKRVNDYCFRYPVEIKTLRPLMVDAGGQGNELRFANHSANPNCETMGVPYQGLVYLLVRATCAISRGEQLTIDYGSAYWKGRARRRLLKNSPLK